MYFFLLLSKRFYSKNIIQNIFQSILFKLLIFMINFVLFRHFLQNMLMPKFKQYSYKEYYYGCPSIKSINEVDLAYCCKKLIKTSDHRIILQLKSKNTDTIIYNFYQLSNFFLFKKRKIKRE